MRERENLSHDFFSRAIRSSSEVRSYSGCIVGRVQFYTIEHDSRSTVLKSGVMVVGEDSGYGSVDNNFYDVLDEVLDVQYPLERCVWLLKCRWFDTYNNKSYRIHMELHYKSINTSHFLFAEESIILEIQAHHVFYLDDPKNGTNWKEFGEECHRHFKKYSDPEQARVNPPYMLLTEERGQPVEPVMLFKETYANRSDQFVSQATVDAHSTPTPKRFSTTLGGRNKRDYFG
ncbi:hypothetical protein E6C27_scaffold319G00140 [Cucumis melo var. makuwa]|uniref:DUF4216 domain-containing protein n=1 Tax=Cucumis melo var. makuwa TaxID=1194695 RepID=A0A5A7UL46_CUCMM|nr:hypothetical protein E6C27_scaffold319G00140 [Cucumis melo var. makuwa]